MIFSTVGPEGLQTICKDVTHGPVVFVDSNDEVPIRSQLCDTFSHEGSEGQHVLWKVAVIIRGMG